MKKKLEGLAGLLAGLGVALLLICLIYGALFSAIGVIVWLQHTGRIFHLYPGIDFSTYARMMYFWHYLAVTAAAAFILHLLYGKRRWIRCLALC